MSAPEHFIETPDLEPLPLHQRLEAVRRPGVGLQQQLGEGGDRQAQVPPRLQLYYSTVVIQESLHLFTETDWRGLPLEALGRQARRIQSIPGEASTHLFSENERLYDSADLTCCSQAAVLLSHFSPPGSVQAAASPAMEEESSGREGSLAATRRHPGLHGEGDKMKIYITVNCTLDPLVCRARGR